MVAGEKLRRRTRAVLLADIERINIKIKTGDKRSNEYYRMELDDAQYRVKLLDKAESRLGNRR